MKTQIYHISPVVVALTTALKLQHPQDGALQRATDKAIDVLQEGIPYSFDGSELRVVSYSRKAEGIEHVCDGERCTCEGRKHPWCYHRVLFRVLLAQAALESPVALRTMIVMEHRPSADSSAEEPHVVDVLLPDEETTIREELAFHSAVRPAPQVPLGPRAARTRAYREMDEVFA